MRVLVDTSIWSLALRRKAPDAEVNKLRDLIIDGEDIFITGIILQELLQGVRSNILFTRVEKHLNTFVMLEPNKSTFSEAARLFNHCRSKGTPVDTVDCLIAAIAIQHNCRLLTNDSDFTKIAATSGLKLL